MDCTSYRFLYDSIPGLVSIIIPTHNRAHLIIETLQSIENQLYDKVEIIVVDDHCTDNTKEVISEFATCSRFDIRYILSDGEGGNHARNLGIVNSKGTYIQFFDDDDLVTEDFFIARIDSIKSGKFDFATCNFDYFLGDTNNIVGYKSISDIPHTIYSHLYHYALPTPCFLFTRKAIERIGFWNESIHRLQDMSYYHRVFKEGLNGFWMNKSLYLARIHDNCISKTVGNDTMIDAWAAISQEWKGIDQIDDVRKLCMERMWELASDYRVKGHFFKWLNECFFMFYRFPQQFCPLLLTKIRKRIIIIGTNSIE